MLKWASSAGEPPLPEAMNTDLPKTENDETCTRFDNDCCAPNGCSPDELKRYREAVRTRIANNDGTIFPNNCPDKTAVVLQEFIRSAKKSVYIYCGQLNAEVYGKLQGDFADAISRKVDVRVVCASEPLQSKELAEMLREERCLRVLSTQVDLPHFAIFDEQRYRIETNQETKDAFVCAYVGEDQRDRIQNIEAAHDILWARAS